MQLTMRRYTKEDDYWRIRAFLRAQFRPAPAWELNWAVYRFDYCRWHGWENVHPLRPEDVLFLWETAGGEIGAVVHPEGPGEVFMQVAAALRTPELEAAMLGVAETHLALPGADDRPAIQVWVNEHDELREAVLHARGYRRGEGPEYQRWRSLAAPIPEGPIAPGYAVRALGDESELPARSWASWKAFHPNAPDAEYQGWTWYRNVQRAALYRRDLDLVAVAPDGAIAGFATVWFDDVTRSGAFEPVGVMPGHQRHGLGLALMREGLRRLRYLGATQATVGSYGPAAHALYEAAGFTAYARSYPWARAV